MLLKYAHASQVRAYSPLLYRYRADWIPEGLAIHDGSLEQIVALQPDLLISGEYNALILRKRLQQLGYRIAVLALPQTLTEIDAYQQQFTALMGHDALPEKSNNLTLHKRNQKLLLLGANGIGTGRDTLEHDLITAAGWDNYLTQSGYINVQLEQLVDTPPDAIFWSAPEAHSLANLFSRHAAIRPLMLNKRPQDENWRWQCPGPWSYELIEELAQW